MKYTTIILSIIALLLSACTTSVSQESDSQTQMSASQPVKQENSPELPPTPHPVRSRWGGFPLNSAGSLWGSFSLYPARSLWGGFPLDLTSAAETPSPPSTNASSSTAPTCNPTDDFCITQHLFPFQRPFSSTFNTSIESSYPYGSTQFEALAPHHGVEILNPTGTPVLAVEDGIVVVAGNDSHSVFGPWEDFYGNLVVLEHHLPEINESVYTLYGHLSTVRVRVGQTVRRGEAIGEVGITGRAIGSHLHFEVRVGANTYANTRNPALWFVPHTDENGQQYGVLAGKIGNTHGDPIYLTVKAEYYPDVNGSPVETYYIETYAPDTNPIGSNEIYQENFILSDLPPGHYRIVLSASGKWTERWVKVEPGKLSSVTILSE